ncbi:hypothetical protein GCM10020331_089580 [Ectobacillus funiculus]
MEIKRVTWMFSLLPFMIERVGVLIIVAFFLLSRLKAFRRIVRNENGLKEKKGFLLSFFLACLELLVTIQV